jgi:hypothetical protein
MKKPLREEKPGEEGRKVFAENLEEKPPGKNTNFKPAVFVRYHSAADRMRISNR